MTALGAARLSNHLSSCFSNNTLTSFPQFVTKSGVSEFIYYLQTYDGSFQNYGDDDAYAVDALPDCEANDYGYMGLDCSSDGSFAINYFNDQYCVSRTGNQYDQLKDVNKMIGNYESCVASYSSGDDYDYSLVHQLIYYSEPCTSLDFSLCGDSEAFDQRSASSGKGGFATYHKGWSSSALGHKSWVTKLKYVIGGLFLLASFIMFTGILFTNRRRRRAMMMRKYRQAKKKKRERGSSSSRKSRSASKRRSKSKSKEGVFT